MRIVNLALCSLATTTLLACAATAPGQGEERADGVYCDSERATGTNIAARNCRSTAQRDREQADAQQTLGTAVKGSTASGRL